LPDKRQADVEGSTVRCIVSVSQMLVLSFVLDIMSQPPCSRNTVLRYTVAVSFCLAQIKVPEIFN